MENFSSITPDKASIRQASDVISYAYTKKVETCVLPSAYNWGAFVGGTYTIQIEYLIHDDAETFLKQHTIDLLIKDLVDSWDHCTVTSDLNIALKSKRYFYVTYDRSYTEQSILQSVWNYLNSKIFEISKSHDLYGFDLIQITSISMTRSNTTFYINAYQGYNRSVATGSNMQPILDDCSSLCKEEQTDKTAVGATSKDPT